MKSRDSLNRLFTEAEVIEVHTLVDSEYSGSPESIVVKLSNQNKDWRSSPVAPLCMSKHIKWLIVIFILAMALGSIYWLGLHSSQQDELGTLCVAVGKHGVVYQLFEAPYGHEIYKKCAIESAAVSDGPTYNWLFFLDITGLALLIIFAVMGYAAYLFANVVFLYCQWWEGNIINWKREAFFLVIVPAVYFFVVLEILGIFGLLPVRLHH